MAKAKKVGKTPGLKLGLGLSGVEEGDDRFRPGILLHVGFLKEWHARGYLYGSEYGPITERTYILSGVRELDIYRMYGIHILKGGFGLVAMNEQYDIDIDGDSENSKTENQFNLGATVGLYANVLPDPFLLLISLESHLFLAGEAGILLSTGRKSMLSVTGGVSF